MAATTLLCTAFMAVALTTRAQYSAPVNSHLYPKLPPGSGYPSSDSQYGGLQGQFSSSQNESDSDIKPGYPAINTQHGMPYGGQPEQHEGQFGGQLGQNVGQYGDQIGHVGGKYDNEHVQSGGNYGGKSGYVGGQYRPATFNSTQSGQHGSTGQYGQVGVTGGTQHVGYNQSSQHSEDNQSGQYGGYNHSGQHGGYNPSGQQGGYKPSGQYGGYNQSGQYGVYNPSGQQGGYKPSGQNGGYNPSGQPGSYNPSGQQGRYIPRGQQGRYNPSGQNVGYIQSGFGANRTLNSTFSGYPGAGSNTQGGRQNYYGTSGGYRPYQGTTPRSPRGQYHYNGQYGKSGINDQINSTEHGYPSNGHQFGAQYDNNSQRDLLGVFSQFVTNLPGYSTGQPNRVGQYAGSSASRPSNGTHFGQYNQGRQYNQGEQYSQQGQYSQAGQYENSNIKHPNNTFSNFPGGSTQFGQQHNPYQG